MDQLDVVVIRSILHDIAASCLQTGTSEKMTSFSMIRKKTPFQKHREEEEAKKKVWGRGGGGGGGGFFFIFFVFQFGVF
jgi:hypothetical protein